jgi:hypothetical protein
VRRRRGATAGAAATRGQLRARSHYRFVLPLTHVIPDSLTYPVPLFLKRQCDQTLGQRQRWSGGDARPRVRRHASRIATAIEAMEHVRQSQRLVAGSMTTCLTYRGGKSPHFTSHSLVSR